MAGIVESIGQRAQQQPFHAMHRRRLLGRNAKALGIEVDRANHRATKHALETERWRPRQRHRAKPRRQIEKVLGGASAECNRRRYGAAGRVLSVPRGSQDAVDTAQRNWQRAAKLDVGGIGSLETVGGRRVFYDINANSNLRPSA